MLATSGVPISLDGWAAEPKLDGWRARVLVDDDGLYVCTRSGRDITASVHGLEPLAISGVRAVLDGELVAGGGRLKDFYLVGPTLARRRPVPGRSVTFVAFDMLWADGELVTRRPYAERRAVLDGLGLAQLGVATIPAFEWDDAPALFEACAAQGVEGLVLKRLAAPVPPGPSDVLLAQGEVRPVGRASGTAPAGVRRRRLPATPTTG